MKRARMGPLLLAAALLTGLLWAPAQAADQAEGRVELKAGAMDSKGCFDLSMTVYDVQFNTFQMVLRYDPDTVTPVDGAGTATTSFSKFADPDPAAEDWLATIGTGIEPEEGLIDFTGYVTPGSGDGGVVKAGGEGVKVFTFRLKKTGTKPVVLELAAESGDKPYREYMPAGVGFADAGEELPMTVTITLPADVGDSSSGSSGGSSGSSGGSSGGGHSTGNREPDVPVYLMSREERLKGTVIFQIGGAAASVEGKSTAIYPGEPGVTAYAHDDRTYVPVRFVAESLGAKVDWENDTQTVVIKSGERTIRMQVGNLEYTVDGEKKLMDAAAEFKKDPGAANSRTMVPIRFVAEALGQDVKWDQATNAVIISPASAPWDLAGAVEKELLSDTLLMLSPLVQSFTQTGEGGET